MSFFFIFLRSCSDVISTNTPLGQALLNNLSLAKWSLFWVKVFLVPIAD